VVVPGGRHQVTGGLPGVLVGGVAGVAGERVAVELSYGSSIGAISDRRRNSGMRAR
jgi:hypothetical protein